MLAAHDNEVVGTDIKKEIVDNLKGKKLTFEEQGMEELFKTALSKKIRFETAPVATDFYIITTPTPVIASAMAGATLAGKAMPAARKEQNFMKSRRLTPSGREWGWCTSSLIAYS